MTTLITIPADPAKAERFWKRTRLETFRLMAPAALCFVASESNVSVTVYDGNDVKRRFGHNRAARPAKIMKGTRLEDDNVEKTHKGAFFKYRGFWRIWVRTKSHRDSLVEAAMSRLEKVSDREGGLEDLENGFHDMGPELDVDAWLVEVLAIARDNGIPAWDEPALLAFIDRVIQRAADISKTWRGGRYSPLEVALTQEFEHRGK
ncbi:hypothetical protein [Hyphomicrobium sp. ghe19]|uniref:hypothetical protein n=1 Tax=Hyphomicrobium sp. ghe19 TaxID=2682968 RepID=UPI0013674A58|nr:hypothetical protein HYPP_03814 [Hyphomicrobium sp. ghe19]